MVWVGKVRALRHAIAENPVFERNGRPARRQCGPIGESIGAGIGELSHSRNLKVAAGMSPGRCAPRESGHGCASRFPRGAQKRRSAGGASDFRLCPPACISAFTSGWEGWASRLALSLPRRQFPGARGLPARSWCRFRGGSRRLPRPTPSDSGRRSGRPTGR